MTGSVPPGLDAKRGTDRLKRVGVWRNGRGGSRKRHEGLIVDLFLWRAGAGSERIFVTLSRLDLVESGSGTAVAGLKPSAQPRASYSEAVALAAAPSLLPLAVVVVAQRHKDGVFVSKSTGNLFLGVTSI